MHEDRDGARLAPAQQARDGLLVLERVKVPFVELGQKRRGDAGPEQIRPREPCHGEATLAQSWLDRPGFGEEALARHGFVASKDGAESEDAGLVTAAE